MLFSARIFILLFLPLSAIAWSPGQKEKEARIGEMLGLAVSLSPSESGHHSEAEFKVALVLGVGG